MPALTLPLLSSPEAPPVALGAFVWWAWLSQTDSSRKPVAVTAFVQRLQRSPGRDPLPTLLVQRQAAEHLHGWQHQGVTPDGLVTLDGLFPLSTLSSSIMVVDEFHLMMSHPSQKRMPSAIPKTLGAGSGSPAKGRAMVIPGIRSSLVTQSLSSFGLRPLLTHEQKPCERRVSLESVLVWRQQIPLLNALVTHTGGWHDERRQRVLDDLNFLERHGMGSPTLNAWREEALLRLAMPREALMHVRRERARL